LNQIFVGTLDMNVCVYVWNLMYVCGEKQNWSLANAFYCLTYVYYVPRNGMSIMYLDILLSIMYLDILMYVLLIFVSGMTHNMVV
jgi:hypothetical protein